MRTVTFALTTVIFAFTIASTAQSGEPLSLHSRWGPPATSETSLTYHRRGFTSGTSPLQSRWGPPPTPPASPGVLATIAEARDKFGFDDGRASPSSPTPLTPPEPQSPPSPPHSRAAMKAEAEAFAAAKKAAWLRTRTRTPVVSRYGNGGGQVDRYGKPVGRRFG